MKSNIVLCGFMGCGKTTVGRVLAQKTGFLPVDSDAEIEACEKTSIHHIFETHGEAYFRTVETEILKQLAAKTNTVISTGGGALVNPLNAEILKRTGFVVFLDVKPETVLERLKNDTTRPLLAGSDRESKVRELMEKRRPLYIRHSHAVIDANRPAEDVARDILLLYKG